MKRTLVLALALGLVAGGPALAQMGGMGGGMGGMGGGMGGGGGGMGGGHGGGNHGGGSAPPPSSDGQGARMTDKITGDKPESQIEITGVVQAIDRATGRMTIAYDPVEELNWPRGTMPFPVAQPKLLDLATVGQRVRFKLDSHEIYEIRPDLPPPAPQ